MADNSIEVENPTLGKMKITGQTVLLILALAAAAASAFGVYLHFVHEAQAKEREISFLKVLEKMTEAQERTIQAQREHSCLIALPQDRREKDFLSENSFCKRITR